MKYLTENAEEKIKEMDFCNLVGFDEDKSGLSSVIEVVERYLQDCEDNEEVPCSELEVDLLKYIPFREYKKGIYLEDIIERLDDEHREEYSTLNDLPEEVFEAEKKLYEAVIKNYDRYWGEIFATIKIDITEEIKGWK